MTITHATRAFVSAPVLHRSAIQDRSVQPSKSVVNVGRSEFIPQARYGALLEILGLGALAWLVIEGSACTPEGTRPTDYNPDSPKETPKPSPSTVPDAGMVDTGQADGGACVPESCDGAIVALEGGAELCVKFAPSDRAAALAGTSRHQGVSVADANADGRDDIYLLDENGSRLFQNSGAAFVPSATGLDRSENSRTAAWSDVDADGDLDVFVAGDNGGQFYQNNNGRFNAVAGSITEPGTQAAWIGRDLLLGTINGLRLFRPDAGGILNEVASEATGLRDAGEATRLAVADMDADGDLDVYVANVASGDRLFRNNGDGTFTSVEGELLPPTNQEGSLDAHWVALPSGRLAMHVTKYDQADHFFVPQSDGTFTDQAAPLGLTNPGAATRAAWGKITSDGPMAQFAGHGAGASKLFVQMTPNRFEDQAAAVGVNVTGAVVGAEWLDANADGKLDLLVVLADGAVTLMENQSRVLRGCE